MRRSIVNRSIVTTTTGTRRRAVSLGLVTALIALLLGAGTGALARLQATLDGPSPATGHAAVIAQGVGEMPFDPIAWRIVRDTAEPLDVALPVERALGFVVAEPDGVHVVDETLGTQERLAAGEASFVAEADVQIRASLTDASASYLRIALVAEADASEPGDDELVFGGQAFAAPEGRRDIDLLRDTLDLDEQSTIAGGDYPVLIMATAGSIEITVGGEPVQLAAGEATEVTGDITVTGLEEGSRVSAGVIGPDVPVPPRTTGTVTVGLFLCDPGVAAEDLGDPIDPDVAASCAPAGDASATLSDADGNELTLDDAEAVREGVYSWNGLSFGDYLITPDATGELVYADREGAQIAGGDVAIDQEFPDVHVDVYIIQSGTGTITATVYNCPEGWGPDSDPAECALTTEGFDITLTSDAATFTLADAEATDSGYVWSGLPVSEDADTLGEGYFVIEESVLPDGYNAFTIFGATAPDGQGGFDYVNLTPDAPDAEVSIYNWNEADPTGTITLDAIECPTVDSGLQDCTRTNGPAGISGIYIQDVDGANEPFTEGNATQDGNGPFVWVNVPLAAYFMDTSGLLPPDGFQIVSVVLTPDGADVGGGFEITDDLRIANIVVVLAPVTGGNEEPAADADADGLSDDDEAVYGTDAANPDSDGDCHADGPEVEAGTDALDSASFPEGDCDMIESTEEN